MVRRVSGAPAPDGPHPVDVAVGIAIRGRGKSMGMSQESLADALGLTFQQVQKYEKGSNRISASKLFETARFLKAPIELFFRGVADAEIGEGFAVSDSETSVHAFLATSEGIELAQAFPRIAKAAARKRVVDLVRALADD